MKYIYIINGREDKLPAYRELYDQLKVCPHSYELYTTLGEGDATRYVRVYCDLHPHEEVCFVACGGDGILNEVASGLVGFEQNQMASLFIGGTTADFLKYYPGRDFRSVEAMLNGTVNQVDILRANDSYSINVCNFGFDAMVASHANDLTSMGVNPHNAYNRGIIRAMLTNRYNRIKVIVDGKRLARGLMLLCTLSNGKQNGGEFICAPYAQNDDGLIEVCYLRSMSLLRLLMLIPLYRRGEHIASKRFRDKVIYRQAQEVEISSNELFDLCLDGEIIPGSHFKITILPKAINFRLPAETNSSETRENL
jgi:diacylglycerol kinase (ATP)